jgi:predicted DNA-binding transcriptional regulator AlpA
MRDAVLKEMRKMERENIETEILMLREDAEYCCVNMKTIYRKTKKGENQKNRI